MQQDSVRLSKEAAVLKLEKRRFAVDVLGEIGGRSRRAVPRTSLDMREREAELGHQQAHLVAFAAFALP